MPQHSHAVVWIDHHEARIIYFNADDADEHTVRPAHPPRHLHSKAGSASGTHLRGEDSYYREIAEALAEVPAFLIGGPSSAKLELVKYLHRHAPTTFEHLAGIEAMDKLTDKELVAASRHYFKAADRMTPQLP